MKALHSIGISENTHWNQSKGLFSCHLAILKNNFILKVTFVNQNALEN